MPGPICFKCQLVITPRTPIATYENRSYHPLCLTCKICNKSVSGEKFLKDENENLICSKCDSIYGPKCKKCNDSFKPGQAYKKLDENLFYHYECFTCCGPCKSPIGAEFYDLDDGKFMCINCYDKYGDLSDIASTEDNPQSKLETPNNYSSPSDKPDDDISKLTSTFNVKLSTANNDANKTDSFTQPQDAHKTNRFENNASSEDNAAKKTSKLKCDKCGLVIQGAYSVYNEKSYHSSCFVCSKCQKAFKERQFFKLDGLAVCSDCHENNLIATSSKCKNCKKPIIDNCLTFMEEEYHENCLKCTSCDIKLMGLSIYTDKQKQAYCLDCFTKKEAKKCEKCLKPIAPNQSNILFEEKPYHQECFSCDSCSRIISVDETFFKNSNDSICCEECAKLI